MPAVSVVLPVFNAATTVARSVQSILDQSMPDLELIVVDDGSTDGSTEVIRAFSDSRLRLIEQAHAGVAQAANLAMKYASSPLIARMDADDFADSERLAIQRDWLGHHNCDVVGSQVRILNADRTLSSTMQNYQHWVNSETLTPEQILAMRFVEFPLVNPTILARREYFELGFRNGDFPEDYDLMLRAFAQGFRFDKVDQILLDWFDSDSRLTRTNVQYSRAAFNKCRQTHLLSGPLNDASQVDLWGVGQVGKVWLDWLQASGFNVRHCYDINPRQCGQKIRGVGVRHASDLDKPDGTPILIAVGAIGSRNVIVPQLESRGYKLGGDAWFVA